MYLTGGGVWPKMVGMGWGRVRFFDDFPGFYEGFVEKPVF